MTGNLAKKGQPLFILVALLAGWAGGRMMSWSAPVMAVQASDNDVSFAPRPSEKGGYIQELNAGPQSFQASRYAPSVQWQESNAASMQQGCFGCRYGLWPGYARPQMGGRSRTFDTEYWPPEKKVGVLDSSFGRWQERAPEYGSATALTDFDVSPYIRDGAVAQDTAAEDVWQPLKRPKRWSLDAWAFLRRGGDLHLAQGVLPATYGANQAGSVLRYRLAPRHSLQPTLYLRTDTTTGDQRYATVAAGVSVRPLQRIPVTLALEARMLDDSIGRHFQPAVMAVTQIPRFTLPHGLGGEVYGQAGYVAGQYATPFADGQIRLDHGLLRSGKAEARIGIGAWGGIQTGVSRLDAGPGVSLAMPLGKAMFGRVIVDWRQHIAGNARPGSGPAVTVSAGF